METENNLAVDLGLTYCENNHHSLVFNFETKMATCKNCIYNRLISESELTHEQQNQFYKAKEKRLDERKQQILDEICKRMMEAYKISKTEVLYFVNIKQRLSGTTWHRTYTDKFQVNVEHYTYGHKHFAELKTGGFNYIKICEAICEMVEKDRRLKADIVVKESGYKTGEETMARILKEFKLEIWCGNFKVDSYGGLSLTVKLNEHEMRNAIIALRALGTGLLPEKK
jgi:hypothetical protein